jgi:hypothetical protein
MPTPPRHGAAHRRPWPLWDCAEPNQAVDRPQRTASIASARCRAPRPMVIAAVNLPKDIRALVEHQLLLLGDHPDHLDVVDLG